MGLLDKLKKGRTRRGQKEKQHQKQPFQQNLSQKTLSLSQTQLMTSGAVKCGIV